MDAIVERYRAVAAAIREAAESAGRPASDVELVAVTKTQPAEAIEAAIEAGHRVFGENRVQEAKAKWPALKQAHKGLVLHLIGPLQSNKAAEAVALFDVIETIDREKIASALAKEIERQGRSPELFVQVNTGEEPQKAGVVPDRAVAFVEQCREKYGLAISGLMCIPPFDVNPGPHFALLGELARKCGLEKLSMGMSGDFETAIAMGATHVRVGTAIFGERPPA